MEVQLSDYIIGFVIFTIVIIAGVSLITLYSSENPEIDSSQIGEFNRTFNKMTELQSKVGELDGQSKASVSSKDEGLLGWLNSAIKKVWNSITFIGSSFTFMTDVISDVAIALHIPSWMVTLTGILISLLIIFSIWQITSGRNV